MKKPYPLVDDLLSPVLRVAMPRAARLLHKLKPLEGERCPVPFCREG